MSHLFSVLPVSDPATGLIGRESEIDRIERAIGRYQNVSIVGEAKIGKTSLLRAVEALVAREDRFKRYVSVFVDLEKVCYALEIERLLDKILRAICQQSGEIRAAGIGNDPDKREAFSEVVEYCTRNQMTILLLLDNFDSLAVLEKLDVGFFTFLRGNAIERGLSIITASRSGLESLCHKGDIASSQFWNVFNPIVHLSCFSDHQFARDLLSRGIQNGRQQERLIALVGPHPCFLKVAGNAVLEAGFSADDEPSDVADAVYAAVKPYYEKCLKQLRLDESVVDEGCFQKLQYVSVLTALSISGVTDQIQSGREYANLVRKGYVVVSAGGAGISGTLFARHLRESVKKPAAYTGDEPFLFVSYSHKDRDEVLDVLQVLAHRNYRFWFDDGIIPGSEWPVDLTKALSNAHTVLVFISPHSMESDWVLKEILYATNRKKRIVPAYLRETPLPMNIELELGQLQGVLKFKDADGFVENLAASISPECRD